MSDGHSQLEDPAAQLALRRARDHREVGGGPPGPRSTSRGKTVLDMACGTGIVARLAATRMGRALVTGIDLNRAMLAVARSVPTEGAAII